MLAFEDKRLAEKHKICLLRVNGKEPTTNSSYILIRKTLYLSFAVVVYIKRLVFLFLFALVGKTVITCNSIHNMRQNLQ